MLTTMNPKIEGGVVGDDADLEEMDVTEQETVNEVDAAQGSPEAFAVFDARVWYVDVFGHEDEKESQGPMTYAQACTIRDLLRPMRSVASIELRRRKKRKLKSGFNGSER